MRDIDRDDDGTPMEDIGRYEVIFDYDGVRYYCYLDAVNIDEAKAGVLWNFVYTKHHDSGEVFRVMDEYIELVLALK